MTDTDTVKPRYSRRQVTVAGLVAALIVAAVAVGAVWKANSGWADGWDYQRDTLTSSTQVAAYDAAMESGRQAHDRGTDGQVWARACQTASYRVAVSMGDDQQLGMLAGCSDSLAAYWGDE